MSDNAFQALESCMYHIKYWNRIFLFLATVPGPPTPPVLSNQGEVTVVTWSAPNNGGDEIEEYLLETK